MHILSWSAVYGVLDAAVKEALHTTVGEQNPNAFGPGQHAQGSSLVQSICEAHGANCNGTSAPSGFVEWNGPLLLVAQWINKTSGWLVLCRVRSAVCTGSSSDFDGLLIATWKMLFVKRFKQSETRTCEVAIVGLWFHSAWSMSPISIRQS